MTDPESDKNARLKAFLDALPSRHALQLLEACEAADDRGDAGLPFDMVRQALEKRADDAIENIFGAAHPLVRDVTGPKRTGVIARSSLMAAAKLASELAPEAFGYTANGSPPLNENRRTLGRVLRRALDADDPDMPKLQKRAGGARAHADFYDMTALLCAEPELSDGLEMLPPLIAEVDADMVDRMRKFYDIVERKDQHASLLLLFLFMERMEKRFQILRVLRKVVGHEDDLIASQTDVGAIGDRLLDEAAQAVEQTVPPAAGSPDGEAIVAAAARFAAISRGMTRELGIRRDGKWGLRLKELRSRGARALEHLCRVAPEAIEAGLAQEAVRLKGGVSIVQPAVERPPHPAVLERTLNYAIVLSGLEDHASACAFSAAYAKARENTIRNLESYCDGLIRFLGEGDEALNRKVEPWLEVAAQVTERLVDRRAADVLRRRAAAIDPARFANRSA